MQIMPHNNSKLRGMKRRFRGGVREEKRKKKKPLALSGKGKRLAKGLKPDFSRLIGILSASLRRYYPDQVQWVLSQASSATPRDVYAIKSLSGFVNLGLKRKKKS